MSKDPIVRGIRAQELLNDPLIAEALAEIEKRYIADWRAAEDPHLRDRAWYGIRALAELQRQLRIIVFNGEHAAIKATGQ